ncbi:hypothetical protein D917_02938 [Trichinella nativa]|uniref:Uncharacterized protein n=1 Tax=Trichinella nativa TaxID=6335 RepID=A0A1Y3EBC2_9BILA|nr:hypothetical protein D917_02938 [Trichinella nativa]
MKISINRQLKDKQAAYYCIEKKHAAGQPRLDISPD